MFPHQKVWPSPHLQAPPPPSRPLHKVLLCVWAWLAFPACARARIGHAGHISKGPDGLTGFICPEFMPLAGDDKYKLQRSGFEVGEDCGVGWILEGIGALTRKKISLGHLILSSNNGLRTTERLQHL